MATFTAAERRRLAREGDAMPDGSFPVRNRSDLENAIRAVGRVSGGESARSKVRRFLIKRARELNLTNLIPDTWNRNGSLRS